VSAPVPIGPILDDLGITLELEAQDRVTEVLILAKTMDLDTGDVALVVASNDLDWIAQAGLHAAASQVFYANKPTSTDD